MMVNITEDELAPNFDVEVRGVMNKINYNIMIPNGFPKRPPYIRIVKPAK